MGIPNHHIEYVGLEIIRGYRPKSVLGDDVKFPDWSIGDVIHAEEDGTIVLDDGITTWNPIRAKVFLDKEKKRLEEREANGC